MKQAQRQSRGSATSEQLDRIERLLNGGADRRRRRPTLLDVAHVDA